MRCRRFAIAFLALILGHPTAAQSVADLVLINAKVRTLDKRRPKAQALASAGGRLIAVGQNQQVRRLAGPKTRIIDAGGRLVIPGFNDAHVHFTAIGNRFSHLDTRTARTHGEIYYLIAEYARFLSRGRWILGSGLDPDAIPPLAERDLAAGDHPLLIYLAGSSSAVVNSASLKLAGINDADGVVMGDDLARVRRSIPANHATDWQAIIETASNYAASLGVTSIQDVHSDDLIDTYRHVAQKGLLKTRVYECIGLAERQKLVLTKAKPSRELAMVRNGCVKGLATGDQAESPDLGKTIAEADAAELQVMVHAIGEGANAAVLDAIEWVERRNGPRDRRFRVEHAHDPRRSDIARFARTRTIASMQPFLFYSGALDGNDDFRSLLAAGVPLAFGSDATMIDLNPLQGIYAAVNSGRRSISMEEALRAYTLGSAFAEFQETVKGKLEIGKAADFIILSQDLFKIRSDQIREVFVLMTVVDGKIVYEDRLRSGR